MRNHATSSKLGIGAATLVLAATVLSGCGSAQQTASSASTSAAQSSTSSASPSSETSSATTAATSAASSDSVVIMELSEARKTKARETGVADHVIDPREQDPVAFVRELSQDGLGANVAFECTSVPAVFDQLLSTLRPAGHLQVVALHPSSVPIDLGQIVMTEKTARGTIGYANVHPEAIEMVRSGKIDLAPFITSRIPVEEIVEQGYTVLHERPEEAVKILVKM